MADLMMLGCEDEDTKSDLHDVLLRSAAAAGAGFGFIPLEFGHGFGATGGDDQFHWGPQPDEPLSPPGLFQQSVATSNGIDTPVRYFRYLHGEAGC